MKIQKMTNGKVVTRDISPDDLGYFQHKGWEIASGSVNTTAADNDFSINRKKKHRFDYEA